MDDSQYLKLKSKSKKWYRVTQKKCLAFFAISNFMVMGGLIFSFFYFRGHIEQTVARVEQLVDKGDNTVIEIQTFINKSQTTINYIQDYITDNVNNINAQINNLSDTALQDLSIAEKVVAGYGVLVFQIEYELYKINNAVNNITNVTRC